METKNLVDAKLSTQIVYISENCRVSIGASSNFPKIRRKIIQLKKKKKTLQYLENLEGIGLNN